MCNNAFRRFQIKEEGDRIAKYHNTTSSLFIFMFSQEIKHIGPMESHVTARKHIK